MREPTLRDYQLAAIQALRELIATGRRRLILQAETGAGKTIMAIAMIVAALAKGKRVLFIARGRRLVGQTSERLWEYGIEHTVMMRGEEYHSAPVVVASKDTILSWTKRHKEPFPAADLVIYDEAHESVTDGGLGILKAYPDTVVIGLTATPARGDGKGLGDFYQGLFQTVPTSRLISEGWLVPTKVFAPYRPDLKGVELCGGDYNVVQLARKMDRMELVGDIVGHWKQLGEDRATIVFCCTIAHSLHVMQEFNRAFVPAKHIDQDTPDDERHSLLKDLCGGTLKVLCSVGVLSQGIDLPPVSCAILARPTRKFVFFRQMVGRIRRPFDGKKDALLLDHAGAVYRHGLPDMDVTWTLKPTTKIEEVLKKRRKEGKDQEPICCPRCYAMFTSATQCPNCGYIVRRKAKPLTVKSGTLVAVNGSESTDIIEDAQRAWHSFLRISAYKGFTAKRAAAMFSGKFGRPPWEYPLQNLPERWEWGMNVAELYPQYIQRKAAP